MGLRRFWCMVPAAIFPTLLGCQKEEPGRRLVEIAIKVQRQEREISLIRKKMGALEMRLEAIQASLRKGTLRLGDGGTGEVGEGRAAGFRDTPEYEKIAAALSAIQQRLNLTERGLIEAKDEVGRARRMARQSMASRELADRLDAMKDPAEMSRRLDVLIETFGQKIEDPDLRRKFEADIEQLKHIEPEKLTTDEVYQLFVSDLTQRLNNEPDPARRQWIQAQLSGLDSLPPEELEGLRQGWERTENFRRLWKLTEKYGIPPGTLRDMGLPAIRVYFEFRDGEVLCGFRQEPESEPPPGEVRTRYEAKNPPKARE